MCFSAEASFSASVALTAIGIASIKKTSSSSQIFLAMIPFLFAIQQFSEGMVWLHLSYHVGSQDFFLHAQKMFLVFAFLIWPVWFPLSLFMTEPLSWRRTLLAINLAAGSLLSLINFFYTWQQDPSAQVVYHSIQYFTDIPSQTGIYLFIVTLPWFLTSLNKAWLIGSVGILSYIGASFFYHTVFISVWCFFAAIISLSIYKILRDYSFERPLSKL